MPVFLCGALVFGLALAGCGSLGSIFTGSTEPAFTTADNSDGTVGITGYTGTAVVEIPANINGKPVGTINQGAFARRRLTDVTIPDSVYFIGGEAFSGNPLTSLTIGKGLIEVGEDAFSGNNLTNVTLAENIIADLSGVLGLNLFCDYVANDRKAGTYTIDTARTEKTADGFRYIETEYGAVIIGGDAPSQFQIPEIINGLTVKAVWGFKGKNLSSVLIPDTVTYIGKEAFMDNPMTSVTIPDSVTHIGNSAFAGTFGTRKSERGESSDPNGQVWLYKGQLTDVIFGNGLLSIGDRSFMNNKLTGVVIPGSVTFIGNNAFVNNLLDSSKDYKMYEIRNGGKLISVMSPSNGITSVSIGVGVQLGWGGVPQDPFRNEDLSKGLANPPGFWEYYSTNDKKAGMYTYNDRSWSFTAE